MVWYTTSSVAFVSRDDTCDVSLRSTILMGGFPAAVGWLCDFHGGNELAFLAIDRVGGEALIRRTGTAHCCSTELCRWHGQE